MKQNKTLKYSKFPGLQIVCKKCQKALHVNSEDYNGCNHQPFLEKQVYKYIFQHNGERKTKNLSAKDYNEALLEISNLQASLKEELKPKFQSEIIQTVEDARINEQENPDLLIDCIMYYLDYFQNIGVPKHEQRNRSKNYVKSISKYLNNYSDFFKSNGYDLDSLTVFEIDKFLFGKYYEHIDSTIKSAALYNHTIKALKGFYNFLEEKEYKVYNPVKKIKLRYESSNPKAIDDSDFLKILSAINNTDCIEVYKNGVKKNMYRPYLFEAFQLSAFTGLRNEEVAILTFSNVKNGKNGEFEIHGLDLKFERAHNWNKTKESKLVQIPMTPELADLIIRLGYEDYKGTDRYLIANDEKANRASIAKQMSHSFTFFKRKAGVSDKVSLKNLRKTFLTKLQEQTGQSSGYHKNAGVTNKNYLDKEKLAKDISEKGFRIFKKKD